MDGIRPTGSDMIKDADQKLNRVLDLTVGKDKRNQVNENQDKSKNENKTTTVLREVDGPDGNTYGIIVERGGQFYIKKKDRNGIYQYLGGEKNLNEYKYPTESKAQKNLNLIIKELNELTDSKENIDVLRNKKKAVNELKEPSHHELSHITDRMGENNGENIKETENFSIEVQDASFDGEGDDDAQLHIIQSTSGSNLRFKDNIQAINYLDKMVKQDEDLYDYLYDNLSRHDYVQFGNKTLSASDVMDGLPKRGNGSPLDEGDKVKEDNMMKYYEEDNDDEEEDDYPSEPENEDIVIHDGRGNTYDVGEVEGKFIGNFSDFDEALKAAKEKMDKDQFWPDLWYVNDHGNVSLLNHEGNVIKEKAESKDQQQAAGMALAAKRGEMSVDELEGAAKDMYDSMTKSELKDYASTKHSEVDEDSSVESQHQQFQQVSQELKNLKSKWDSADKEEREKLLPKMKQLTKQKQRLKQQTVDVSDEDLNENDNDISTEYKNVKDQMKDLAKQYKYGDEKTKKQLKPKLKDLTQRKRDLEKEILTSKEKATQSYSDIEPTDINEEDEDVNSMIQQAEQMSLQLMDEYILGEINEKELVEQLKSVLETLKKRADLQYLPFFRFGSGDPGANDIQNLYNALVRKPQSHENHQYYEEAIAQATKDRDLEIELNKLDQNVNEDVFDDENVKMSEPDEEDLKRKHKIIQKIEKSGGDFIGTIDEIRDGNKVYSLIHFFNKRGDEKYAIIKNHKKLTAKIANTRNEIEPVWKGYKDKERYKDDDEFDDIQLEGLSEDDKKYVLDIGDEDGGEESTNEPNQTPDEPDFDNMGDESDEEDETGDPTQEIQSLTGKLGQKIYQYRDNHEVMDEDLIKYVVNSVLDNIDFDNVSDETKDGFVEQIQGDGNDEPEFNDDNVADMEPPQQTSPETQNAENQEAEAQLNESKKKLTEHDSRLKKQTVNKINNLKKELDKTTNPAQKNHIRHEINRLENMVRYRLDEGVADESFNVAYQILDSEIEDFHRDPAAFMESMGWNPNRFSQDIELELTKNDAEELQKIIKPMLDKGMSLMDIYETNKVSDFVVNKVAEKIKEKSDEKLSQLNETDKYNTDELIQQAKEDEKRVNQILKKLQQTNNKELSQELIDIEKKQHSRSQQLINSSTPDENSDKIHDAMLVKDNISEEIPTGYSVTIIDSYYSPTIRTYVTTIQVTTPDNDVYYDIVNTFNKRKIGATFRNQKLNETYEQFPNRIYEDDDVKTVRDLNDREDLNFISDSQDVEHMLDILGFNNDDYDSLFVKTKDGEIIEAYGLEGIVPWLGKTVDKLV